MGAIEIETTLEEKGPAAAVVLSDEQVAAVGEGAKAFPVKATINGCTWDGRVSRMKGESEVEMPEALLKALAGDGDARTKFDALAFTHRKELARWITEAKRDDTRDRRIVQALAMLHEGKTRS